MSKKIEAEGQELVLRNTHGDVIIVPKKDRVHMLELLKNKKHSNIDSYANSLPDEKEYADDGTKVLRKEKKANPTAKELLDISEPMLNCTESTQTKSGCGVVLPVDILFLL